MSPGPGEGRALAGRTVVVTRPADRAGPMVEALEARGARVLLLPAVRLEPPEDPAPLRDAVARLSDFDWVVLTSPGGVRAVVEACSKAGSPTAESGPRRLAVVGRATARSAREAGWEVHLVPRTFTGEGLLEAMDEAGLDLEGVRVLLPLAEEAREVVPRGLAERGARVERVVAYRTRRAPAGRIESVREALEAGSVDLLTFTSPSTVEGFLEMVGEGALHVPAAVIGPVTGRAARELGYRVVAEADPHTAPALVEAVVRSLVGR